MSADEKKLVALARDNPWHFFGADELATITGLSVRAIRAMAEWGAPFIAKKSRPDLLLRWIAEHPDQVGKLE